MDAHQRLPGVKTTVALKKGDKLNVEGLVAVVAKALAAEREHSYPYACRAADSARSATARRLKFVGGRGFRRGFDLSETRAPHESSRPHHSVAPAPVEDGLCKDLVIKF